MLSRLVVIKGEEDIQSFGYNADNKLIYHVMDKLTTNTRAIYKARINSLNRKSKLAYIEYMPNQVGIINLKKSTVQAGSNLLCQLTWQGDGEKQPKFSAEIKLFGKYVIILPYQTGHYFSKNLKTSLNEICEKYHEIGIIFRSSIDYLSEPKLIEDEIKFLLNQIKLLQSSPKLPIGRITAPTYKFMQLLCEARLANAMEIYTNSKEILDLLWPYESLWQLGELNLDITLTSSNIQLQLDKTYTEFNLEIHTISGINLIDVNSRNAALNFYQVNYLAIDEIIRQIWLRDLCGIILIDFIKNMSTIEKQNIRDKLSRNFTNDWRKHQILGFTRAEIFEIIRNK